MDEKREEEKPLISIIMPAWNAEQTIEEAIRSVQEQTYPFWELIVIDDHSSDQTGEKVLELASEDSRICLKRNRKNLGVSRSRNRGVDLAGGNWVAFLDSDDLWRRDKLEKQVRLIHQKKEAELIFTGSAFIRGSAKSVIPISYKLSVPEVISYRQLLKQNVISCSSVLVRKELLLQYPMRHDNMHEDYAVWLQILKNGFQARGIDEPLLIYRLSPGSKSGHKNKAAIMTYRVYRFMGLGHVQALYYFMWYAAKSLKKYFLIRRRTPLRL